MGFIRPEVKDTIWRWREALIGAVVSLVGMYIALSRLGLLSIVGTSLAVAGALLVFAGIQRTRFRVGKDGTGVVQIDEGQVIYYGPTDGGSVTIAALNHVELDPTNAKAEWILHDPNTASLRIPIDAKGAEALFDVLGGLDGMKMDQVLHLVNDIPEELTTIWQADA